MTICVGAGKRAPKPSKTCLKVGTTQIDSAAVMASATMTSESGREPPVEHDDSIIRYAGRHRHSAGWPGVPHAHLLKAWTAYPSPPGVYPA